MTDAAVRQPDPIQRMSVSIVSLPVTSRRSHGIGDTAGAVRNVILRLETKAGVVGWGEAAPWPAFAGTAEASAAALDRYLRPLVMEKDPGTLSAIMAAADVTLIGHADAKAALETALLDLLGHISGLSVAELLGGRCRDRIPLSVSLANPDFGSDMELAARVHGDGVRIFKLKTGFADHAFDVMRLEKLKDRFPDTELRVDYNQGLEPFDALPRLRDIEALKPGFIEQPVRAQHRGVMSALKRQLEVPLLADESIFTPTDAVNGAASEIADGVSVKIFKSGGLRAAQKVAAIAGAAGMAAYGGDMMESGLAHLAGTHLVGATPEISLGCEFYQAAYYLQEDLLAGTFPLADGAVIVPKGPGLGFAVDETILKRVTEECRES